MTHADREREREASYILHFWSTEANSTHMVWKFSRRERKEGQIVDLVADHSTCTLYVQNRFSSKYCQSQRSRITSILPFSNHVFILYKDRKHPWSLCAFSVVWYRMKYPYRHVHNYFKP